MAGWGEPKGPSDEIVRRAEERRTADLLADVVAAYLTRPTTSNRDRVAAAHVAYESVRGQRVRIGSGR